MAKSKSQVRHGQQLQLRVFSQIDGGKSKQISDCSSETTHGPAQRDGQSASAEDQAVYQAIADRYLNPKR